MEIELNWLPDSQTYTQVQYVLSKAGVMEESVNRELNIIRSEVILNLDYFEKIKIMKILIFSK